MFSFVAQVLADWKKFRPGQTRNFQFGGQLETNSVSPQGAQGEVELAIWQNSQRARQQLMWSWRYGNEVMSMWQHGLENLAKWTWQRGRVNLAKQPNLAK